MSERNRSSGWTHAKRSGHKNEDLIKQLLDSDSNYAAGLLSRIGLSDEQIHYTSVGGLHETSVPGVLGRKTKSKTDLKLYLCDDTSVNISIKKSLAGQVYFIGADGFISTFSLQFQEKIPANVQRAIRLFWAAADDALEIIQEHASHAHYDLQFRHKSLNADTLRRYDPTLHADLLEWFSDNAGKLSLLCFAMGGAKSRADWAQYVWYKNMLGEHTVDEIIPIQDICRATQRTASSQVYYGSTNGGTTIQLPFGFVEWHQRKMQFHHKYSSIQNLLHT